MPSLFPPVVERFEPPITIFPVKSMFPPAEAPIFLVVIPMLLSPPFIFICPFVTVNLPFVANIPMLFLANFSNVISGACIFAPTSAFVYITPIEPSTVSTVFPSPVGSLPLLFTLVVVLVSISVQFTPAVSFLPLPI
ncbi:unknown [Fusobacterium sp. CAG:649]|nr:unknown [Fusobacterium sp. CAG:649]